MAWWIPLEKQYRPETKRWYCRWCDKRTPIERNPLWDGAGEGSGKAPEWFARCSVCKKVHYQSAGFGCPNCGWDGEDEGSLIASSKPRFSYWAAMEFGGDPMDWDETHKCKKCGTVFKISNGNY